MFVGRSSGTTGATAQQINSTTLTGFNNAVRIQRTAGNTSTNDLYIGQSLETLNSTPLAGQTVTLSFYARAGANYSAASSNLAVRLYSGTGTDQSGLGSAFTGTASPVSTSQVITTSWVRYSFTATISSAATQLQFLAFYTPSGTAGAADYFDITGIMLEVGSQVSPFVRAGGTIQGELAACQRYYETTYDIGTAAGTATETGSYGFCVGTNTSGANYFTYANAFKVTKRATPTITLYDLSGNSGKVNKVSAVDLTMTANQTGTADRIGQSEFRVYAALGTAGGFYGHYVASAEL